MLMMNYSGSLVFVLMTLEQIVVESSLFEILVINETDIFNKI